MSSLCFFNYSPQNGKEFFVIQMFERATAPSIGFFKKLEEKNPLEIINEKLKMNIESGFMPFLESSDSSKFYSTERKKC